MEWTANFYGLQAVGVDIGGLGTAEVTPTDAGHAHVDANGGSAGAGSTVGLTVRDVRYAVSAHVHLHSDGRWRVGVENPAPGAYSMSAHRAGEYNRPPAPTILAKIVAAVEDAANALFASPEGRRSLVLAEQRSAETDRDRADRELADLAAKVKAAKAERRAALRRLARATDAMAALDVEV